MDKGKERGGRGCQLEERVDAYNPSPEQQRKKTEREERERERESCMYGVSM